MSRHLSDEEILDLIAPGIESNPHTRDHLADCPECRARIEAERALSRSVADLPTESDPPRDLWPALRARLEAERVSPSGLRGQVLLRAAAAIALFLLGAFAGRAWERSATEATRVVTDPLVAAAEVQRTGTEYVAAVARFRAVAGRSEEVTLDQAREVALAAVHGASFELTRLLPDDATAREILALADESRLTDEAR